jgi:chromosome partitioning protein
MAGEPDPLWQEEALAETLFPPEELPAPEVGEQEQPVELTFTPPKPLPRGEIIALANQKGGVGKTTTTISLGAALAEEGARILLVDFDPQGALSVGLGLNPNSLEATVYNLLLDPSTSLRDVVHRSKIEGLDLLPSNIDLSAAEVQLVSEVAREQMLKRALEPAKAFYNYILIDCPPSLGLLTINALTAADSVIIPLECEYFALRGMALLMDTIRKVQERLNAQLEIKGILATMLDSRTIHSREVLARVGEAFGDRVFKTVIRKTVKFAEAPVAGEPILTYAPRSGGSQEYRDLAREVMYR